MEIHFLGIQGYSKGQPHKNGSKPILMPDLESLVNFL